MSFDAPVAYFGLGQYEEVKRIVIEWSTGEVTQLDYEFPADHTYIITRKLKETKKEIQKLIGLR